eukprot:2702215-Pleurochrysis_carterae.AAC.1
MATFIPFAWHAAAVTRPARPPPATSTRSGSASVTCLPPGGTSSGVRHQAASSPLRNPRPAAASAAARSARSRTSATRCGDSGTRFGASARLSTCQARKRAEESAGMPQCKLSYQEAFGQEASQAYKHTPLVHGLEY